LKPAHSVTSFQGVATAFIDFPLLDNGKLSARSRKPPFNLVLRVFRPQKCPLHAIEQRTELTWAIEVLVVGRQRGTQRTTGVAGRWLHPDVLEGAIAQYSAIANAIERNTTREAQIVDSVRLGQAAGEAQHDLLGHLLHRRSQIHFALGEPRLRIAWRSAKQLMELVRRHRQAGRIVEVALVEPERSIIPKIDQFIEDELRILGLAVGRKAHDLILARVDFESSVVSKSRVQQAKAVWLMDLTHRRQGVAAANRNRCGGPFADTIHGEDHGFIEWRWKEGGCGMALVMLSEQKFAQDLAGRCERAQCPLQIGFLEKLFLDPDRNGGFEGRKAIRRVGQVCL